MNRLELAEKLREIAYDVEQGKDAPSMVDGVPCWHASGSLTIFGDSCGKEMRFDVTDLVTAERHAPCRICDADGNDLGELVRWANVKTGEYARMVESNERPFLLEERCFAKAPLRVEAIKHKHA